MKKEVFKYLKFMFGLFICSLGMVIILKTNLGSSPWTSFYQGVSNNLPLTLGQVQMLAGLFIISIDVCLGEKIGSGSILSILLYGIFLDFLSVVMILQIPNLILLKILLIFLGIFLFTYGTFIYINTGLGVGALDSLMLGLSKKFHMQAGKIRNFMEVTALLLAILLGGSVGIGTIIYSLFIGYFLHKQFLYHKCQPENIMHRELKNEMKSMYFFTIKKVTTLKKE